jgi:hypothetical protein
MRDPDLVDELVVRPALAATTPRATYLVLIELDRIHLNDAMRRMKARARELTPAAAIARNPGRWVLGGFAVGLAFALITVRPRSR